MGFCRCVYEGYVTRIWCVESGEEALLACFDTATAWRLHAAEALRRDLPIGSARVMKLGALGAYGVD